MPKRSTPAPARRALATPVAAFCASLGDPRTRLAVPQAGYERIPSGWTIKPRAIPEHLLFLVTESELQGRINRTRLRVGPGTLVWVMPGVLHEFFYDDAKPRPMQYHLKFELAPLRGAGLRLRSDALIVRQATGLRTLFDAVVREWRGGDVFAPIRLRASLMLMLSGALRLQGGAIQDGPQFDAHSRQILEHAAARLRHERISPAQLAAQLGLNAEYFTRVFRRSFGMSPRAWLVRERLNAMASRLRDSTEPIGDIARVFGYPDIFLFSRQFKKIMGVSPSAYRRSDDPMVSDRPASS